MIARIKLFTTAAALIAAGALAPAFAEGDAEAGATLAYTCLGCHGIPGYRNAYPSFRVPKLGGQRAAYLEIALRGYRDGTRQHPTMVAQASSLTDQQITDISAYLAAMVDDTVDAGASSAPSLDLAATCVACHGQNGIGLSPNWPTLAGQHEDYLVHSLTAYRDGTRTDPVMAPMAANLSDADIAILATFYSSLEGLETTEKD